MRKILKISLIITCISIFLNLSFEVQAEKDKATLNFKHVNVEDEYITTDIWLDTGGHNVNVVTADFSYPSDLLELKSVSTDQSLFEYSVKKDSSKKGEAAITLYSLENPKGSGTVARLSFEIIAPGKATLKFLDTASVMDSTKVVDILGNKENGIYTLDPHFDMLPQTGAESSTTKLNTRVTIALIVFSMIVFMSIISFSIWGAIYYSLSEKNKDKKNKSKN